eukprot:SAG31_NODE_22646_length_520_cov_15.738717_1_plen_108_part_00
MFPPPREQPGSRAEGTYQWTLLVLVPVLVVLILCNTIRYEFINFFINLSTFINRILTPPALAEVEGSDHSPLPRVAHRRNRLGLSCLKMDVSRGGGGGGGCRRGRGG